MIIKKKNFALTPGFKSIDWPFTVPEVAIIGIMFDNNGVNTQCFAIIHDFKGYALSGLLESYSFEKLENSWIWAPATHAAHCIPAPKKSLSPFFRYLEMKVKG